MGGISQTTQSVIPNPPPAVGEESAPLILMTEELMETMVEKMVERWEARSLDNARTIAETTAQDVVNELRRRTQEDADRRLRNTKLLLKRYRDIKAHCDDSIYHAGQIPEQETAEELFRSMARINRFAADHDVFLNSVLTSVTRSRILMAHVDQMVDAWTVSCQKSGREDKARWTRLVRALYIDGDHMPRVEDVAETENIDRRTVYKNIDKAAEDLSPYLFGIDALLDSMIRGGKAT